MLRLTIITQDNYFSLGLNGVTSFFKALNKEEIDPVQTLDDTFMMYLQSMKTHPYGFTADFKKKFLRLIAKAKDQKILITRDFISTYKSPRAQYLMRVVTLLNQGHTLETAEASLKTQTIKTQLT